MTTSPVTKNRFSDTYSNNRVLTATPAQMELMAMLNREHIGYTYEKYVYIEGETRRYGEPKFYKIDVLVHPRIAVNLNGRVHGRTIRSTRHDEKRSEYLKAHDYIELTFQNEDVFKRSETVLNAIRAEMH